VIAWGWRLRHPPADPFRLPTDRELALLLPGSTTIQYVAAPLPHWRGEDMEGLRGVVFLTDQIEPRVTGFVSEIRAAVGLDAAGKITGVIPLGHHETPVYFNMLPRQHFFDQFAEGEMRSDLPDVDAITGATITSEAIRDDVLFSGRLVAKQVLGLNLPTTTEPISTRARIVAAWNTHRPEIVVLALAMLLWIIAALIRRPWLRWLVLGVSFGVVGCYLNAPVTLAQLGHLLVGQWPPWANLPLVVLLVFAGLVTLTSGRFYCNHICPFGAAQEFTHLISPVAIRPRPKTLRRLTDLRFLLLALALLAFFLKGFAAALAWEPFQFLFDRQALVGLWPFALAVLAASLFVHRFWCRVFCPTGALFHLLTQARSRLRNLFHRGRRTTWIDGEEYGATVEAKTDLTTMKEQKPCS